MAVLKHSFFMSEIVDLTIASARIIKEVDPEAKIAAFGLAGPRRVASNEAIIADLTKKLKANNEEHLIDWITYHGYQYIPEESYFTDGDSLRAILKRHDYNVAIWQGECGAFILVIFLSVIPISFKLFLVI